MKRIHQPEYNHNSIAKSGKGDDIFTFDDDCDIPGVVVYIPLDIVSNCRRRQEHNSAKESWIVVNFLKEIRKCISHTNLITMEFNNRFLHLPSIYYYI